MSMVVATQGHASALNAICPYFTMFPLRFPLGVLRRGVPGETVLDPFCGRGTTNFAARLSGLSTIGVDCNAVAVAATEAKLALARPEAIVREARAILSGAGPRHVPAGEFWGLAYQKETLERLCLLREALVKDCESDERKALRGIILGALHGPLRKNGGSSYFSNQSPRTYAPKPRYAVRFWQARRLLPPRTDVLELIASRAVRFYSAAPPSVNGRVYKGDSRKCAVVVQACAERPIDWIITSPPYYGLRTYGPDQWLRNWFLGGPAEVDYSYGLQVSHNGTGRFVDDLRRVWLNVAGVAAASARLVVRFGAINDRQCEPVELIKASLRDSPWRIVTRVAAGDARQGKRQADTFRVNSRVVSEFDLWAIKS
jgi:hypothetical protein